MPPCGGIGGGRSCSAARRVFHTPPSGRGFQKAPRNGRQPAGGTGIRQKERKWLSAGLCCGSMRRPPAKRRKKPLFGKAGHTVNRNASLIKGLHSHSQTGRSVQRRPKRRRKQRRPRATAGEARFPPARGICRPTVRKVCRPTTREVRCPTAAEVRRPTAGEACRPAVGEATRARAGTSPPGGGKGLPPGMGPLPPATASAVPPP